MPAVPLKLKKRPDQFLARVLHDEVAVEHEGSHLGERREVAVDVLPAALDDGDLGV